MPVQLMHPMELQVLFKRRGEGRKTNKSLKSISASQSVLRVTLDAANNKSTFTIKLHLTQTKGASQTTAEQVGVTVRHTSPQCPASPRHSTGDAAPSSRSARSSSGLSAPRLSRGQQLTHHRAGRSSHRPAPRALIPQNPVALGGRGGRDEKFAALIQNRRRPYRCFPSRFLPTTLFLAWGGGIPVASGSSSLPTPRLGARGAAGLRPPRRTGKRREKFERGKGRQQLQPRGHLGGCPGERRRRRSGRAVCKVPEARALRAPASPAPAACAHAWVAHRAPQSGGSGGVGQPLCSLTSEQEPRPGAVRLFPTLSPSFPSLSRQGARARRDPAAPPALTWAPSKNSPAESWARAAPSRAGERPASRASAASSGSEAAVPAPLPMPTCGEVCERGRCCPGPRRRAERTSTAPLAAAPRQEIPAPRGARWPRGRPLGQPCAARRARRRWHRFPSYSGVTLLPGERGGGRSRARTSNPRSPALGTGNVGLRPAALLGSSGARQRLLLQARGQRRLRSALPGSPPLRSDRLSLARRGSARLPFPWLSSARLSSALSGTAQPGSARLRSARLSTAQELLQAAVRAPRSQPHS